MALVKYLGNKAKRIDYKTTTIWHGHGDVQEISAERAEELCKFVPGTFMIVDMDEPEPEENKKILAGDTTPLLADKIIVTETTGEEVPLSSASVKAVADHCKSLGLNVLDRHTRAELIDMVIQLHRAQENLDEVQVPEEPLPEGQIKSDLEKLDMEEVEISEEEIGAMLGVNPEELKAEPKKKPEPKKKSE